jgi:hypothetical protein
MKKSCALAILFTVIILASSFTPKQPLIAVSVKSIKKVLDPFQGWFYYNGLVHKYTDICRMTAVLLLKFVMMIL